MIIGITGTIGAGKGVVVDYLVKEKNFKHYSSRDFITLEIMRRGLSFNRPTMQSVANELRQQYGPAYIIKSLYARAAANGGNAVIESIRAIGEAQYLQERGVRLLAVDADRKLRYERITHRASETDHITFDEFCKQEDREMGNTEPWDMNIAAVMQLADFRIENKGTLEQLHGTIDNLFTQHALD